MNDPFAPCVGGVLSADIAVPEHERELRFYSRVLCTGDRPLWKEDLTNNLGMPVIGLGKQTAEYDQLPLQWMPHIQVEDVAASTSEALRLGGTELMHHKDASGTSQWSVLTDPSGAAFGLIPVVSSEDVPGAETAAQRDTSAPVGCIAWLDLTVSAASSIRDFYRKVVDWSVQDVEMQDASGAYADYEMNANGKPIAGVCHARGANEGLPAVWMLYLPVADLAESVRRVKEEGGKTITEMQGVNGECQHVVVQDPVGVCFALSQA